MKDYISDIIENKLNENVTLEDIYDNETDFLLKKKIKKHNDKVKRNELIDKAKKANSGITDFSNLSNDELIDIIKKLNL